MTMGKIILADRATGKTYDALEWFKQQPSPKAYIMPTMTQVTNLPLDTYYKGEEKISFISESALDKLRGINWEAIVIDELDQFNDPLNILTTVMFCNAHLYICGTMKKDASALKILALKFHNCEHTVYYKTPEIAKMMEESYNLIYAIWGKPNVHPNEH